MRVVRLNEDEYRALINVVENIIDPSTWLGDCYLKSGLSAPRPRFFFVEARNRLRNAPKASRKAASDATS